MRPVEVATGKWSFVGRSEGCGSSKLDAVVDFDAPDRMEFVAGSGYREMRSFLAEEGSNVDYFFWLK